MELRNPGGQLDGGDEAGEAGGVGAVLRLQGAEELEGVVGYQGSRFHAAALCIGGGFAQETEDLTKVFEGVGELVTEFSEVGGCHGWFMVGVVGPSFRLSPLSSLLGMVRPHLHVTSLWAGPSFAVAAILLLSHGMTAEAKREKSL